jgi:rubrerythrin
MEVVAMSKTEGYLKEAFAGESQANRKYLAFAAAADKEGYPQIARLFRAAAEAETIHAHNHLRVLKGIRTTKENLQEAIGGETHEFTEMYPEMIKAAQAENNKDAERSFSYANSVEKVHARLYEDAVQNMNRKEDYPYFVCPVCGYTADREAPDTCPVCGAKGKTFKRIE